MCDIEQAKKNINMLSYGTWHIYLIFIYKEEWLEISLIPSLRWVSRHYTTPPNVSLMGANGLNQIMMIYYVLDFLIRRIEKRGSRREWKESQNPKDMINSLRIPLTFKWALCYQTRKINYVPPQWDLKSSQQSPSFRQAWSQ